MECPICKADIPAESLDVCLRAPNEGVEVFFDCESCENFFVAIVKPEQFEECISEEDD